MDKEEKTNSISLMHQTYMDIKNAKLRHAFTRGTHTNYDEELTEEIIDSAKYSDYYLKFLAAENLTDVNTIKQNLLRSNKIAEKYKNLYK